jgi:hypothetical protein
MLGYGLTGHEVQDMLRVNGETPANRNGALLLSTGFRVFTILEISRAATK